MKKTSLALGTAIAMTLVVGGAALAQNAERPDRALRADADGDGRISRAEFVDGRVARLTAIDANRDGSVSAEERQSGRDTQRNQRVSARFETLDKDGNGALSREEFTTGAEMRGERAGRGGHHGMGGRDGHGGGHGGGERGPRAEASGSLSIAEMTTRRATRFDRIDADHDGFVTLQERHAIRDGMREQRRARRAVGQPSPSATASE